METRPSVEFAVFAEDRDFVRTLAQLARLDPRIRVREDESDLVQETFVKALNAYPAEELLALEPSERRKRLRVVFESGLVDRVRHHRAQKRAIDAEQARRDVDESTLAWENNVAAAESSPSQLAVKAERFERLAIAVQSLPEPQRSIAQLYGFVGKKLREIAVELDLTEDQVAGHYRRGLDRLRKILKEREQRP
jgi:RNA polymerase sigma-70 factor, ECF subfamily